MRSRPFRSAEQRDIVHPDGSRGFVQLKGHELITWAALVMFPADPDNPESCLSIMREDHFPRIHELYMKGYIESIKPNPFPGAKFYYEEEFDEECNNE